MFKTTDFKQVIIQRNDILLEEVVEKKNTVYEIIFITINLLFLIACFYLIYSYREEIIFYFKNEINNDNILKCEKEENQIFTKYSSTIKPIALYNQNIYSINESLTNNNKKLLLENQINLAKEHGIYGFGFYYFWPFNKNSSNDFVDILTENKNLNMKFLLLWQNDKKEPINNLKITQFFYYIKKYIEDTRYIKFNNKYVIGVNYDDIDENNINILRQRFKENGLGDIFILSNINDNSINSTLNNNTIDGQYFSTEYDSLEKVILHYNKTVGYFYLHLIYHNLFLESTLNESNLNIFRTSIPITKSPFYLEKEKKTYIYGDYTPLKFYWLNKILIDWTIKNHNDEDKFLFINEFHDLEKNDIFGYANINYFSKALFGIPLINSSNFNLNNLQKNALIAIQAHVYYTEFLPDIVNKTNNIPVPFNLFITTNTEEKKIFIENYLKNNTKANKYEILITQNKGRDVIPLLTQLKDILKNYKYFCHIHTKKHGETDILGKFWRIYLYENLLGNKDIISQILTDFENNDKIGIIFPEPFYVHIKHVFFYNPPNYIHLNFLLDTLFPTMELKILDVTMFPVGNMFWARVNAVYQMFDERIIKSAPEEEGQGDGTLLHAIERFWLFLTKLNGYKYKSIMYYI